MTITASDIVLYKTERLTDTTDGGGYPTSRIVTDNLSNDVFPGISELDSMGVTKFRKLAMGIDTATSEVYYGSGVYILKPPTNSAVETLLIEATAYEDEASDIKEAIESYLVKSVLTSLVLYGPHPQGLTTVFAYERTTDRVPQPGEVYCLDDGDETHDFYFRVIAVESEDREFEDENGVFLKKVVTLTINAPLDRAFEGEDIPVRQTISPDVKIRGTIPAEAVDFHSTSGIDPVSLGAQVIYADSVYSHIMPSSEQEVPIVDYLAGSERSILVGTANTAFPIVIGNAGSHIYLPCAVKPGSVSVTGTGTYTDNGDGTLSSGGNTATINYDVADIIFPMPGTWTISAIPAANIIGPAHTMEIPITVQNRGFTYIRTLSPIPSPGQCFVDYRVDDIWYRLEDNGSGILQGIGTGVINFGTGTLRVTTEAYPDIGSSVIITWGTDVHLEIRAGDASITLPALQGSLDQDAVDYSTVEFTWLSGAVEKTAISNAAGVVSGDGTGYIRNIPDLDNPDSVHCFYSVVTNNDSIPDPGSLLSISYETRATFTEEFIGVALNVDTYTFTINASHLPLDPEKLHIFVSLRYRWPLYANRLHSITSDASGNLTTAGGYLHADSHVDAGTGVVTLRLIAGESDYFYFGWDAFHTNLLLNSVADFSVIGEKIDTYIQTSDNPAISSLKIDLTPLDSKIVAQDGIILDVGGTRLYTRNGIVYKGFNSLTQSGEAIGSINYQTGIIAIMDWTGLSFDSFTVRSLAVIRGDWGIDYIYGRTPIAPLRHSSFEISATTLGGVTYTAIADANGIVKDVNEDAIDGTINDTTGVFSLRFGETIEDASLTPDDKLEPWYDPNDVEAGLIWRPTLMLPNSLRINAVGLFYLPASEEDIGINSTRLPQDGRVRSIKKGDKIIVHHTGDFTMPSPLSAGQQVQLPRGSLSMVRLFDTEDDLVPTTKWSVNLASGLITMSNPLDLTGYPQPLLARHTIRDSAKVIDSLISGETTLSRPISHDYPSGSYVSSLLVAGNRFARVENLRTIETWIDFEHADGDPAIGQYNDVDFPILVTNAGCEDDDWAFVFQSSSVFVAIGRRRGQLPGTGSTTSDYAPINPLTNLPFFTIYASGWSSGFITGNALRLETRSAKFPFWTAQCIQPTTPPTSGDSFTWATFGNVE